MPELLLCCALRCSHSHLFCALWCCLLLLQLSLLFNHLCSSAFSPFSTGFCLFCIFHTSLSPISPTALSPFLLHKLMRFFMLSFISLTGRSPGQNVVNATVCCSTVCCSFNYYTSILFVGHKCRNFFCVAHFRAAILDFSARFGAASCWCNFAFCSTT